MSVSILLRVFVLQLFYFVLGLLTYYFYTVGITVQVYSNPYVCVPHFRISIRSFTSVFSSNTNEYVFSLPILTFSIPLFRSYNDHYKIKN